MLLSMIAVAFRNPERTVKTRASLAYLAQVEDISLERIVADGGSNDGICEYLENLNGIFSLRSVNEPDNGIYDATDKGIATTQGKFALFLSSGDIFHQSVVDFVRKLEMQKDSVMTISDALLDSGDRHKIKCSAKPGWYIYHSLPASYQVILLPASGLKKWRYDPEYEVSSDYMLAVRIYKTGYASRGLSGPALELPMGGVSTVSNMELCAGVKKAQRQILYVPGFWAELSRHLRQHTISKTKVLYNKV